MRIAKSASKPHAQPRGKLFACALAAALLLGAAAPAQSQSSGATSASPQDAPAKPGDPKSAPYSMRVNVPLVTLDVSVLTSNGNFVPELKKENFHVFEDGVPQTVLSFSERHAPITAVLLVEFNADVSPQQIIAVRASYSFTKSLKNDDWTALLVFDKHLRIAQDFTQDKSALQERLSNADLPLSREINLFDALIETLDRLQGVEGRKYILLLASGQDTFSKAVLDDVLNRIELARDTVIFSIDTGLGLRHLQADNQMATFARMTGGRIFFPGSPEDYSGIFHDIGQTIRNHYLLSYRPAGSAPVGAWRKIKVTVVNPATTVPGSKEDIGRNYQIITREGYRVR
jgi:VWFA-related protein